MKKNFLGLFFIFSIISANFLKSSELGLKGLGELLEKYKSLTKPDASLNNLKQAMAILDKLASDKKLAKLTTTNHDYEKLFINSGVAIGFGKCMPMSAFKIDVDDYYKSINEYKLKISNKIKVYNFLENPNKNDLDEFLKIFLVENSPTKEKILDELSSNLVLAELYSEDKGIREIFKINGFEGTNSTGFGNKKKFLDEYYFIILTKKNEIQNEFNDIKEQLLCMFITAVICENVDKLDKFWKVRDLVNLKSNGKTALMEAVIHVKKKSAEKLIELGANINEVSDETGETALLISAKYNLTGMSAWLLLRGADINIADKTGKKFIDYANELDAKGELVRPKLYELYNEYKKWKITEIYDQMQGISILPKELSKIIAEYAAQY